LIRPVVARLSSLNPQCHDWLILVADITLFTSKFEPQSQSTLSTNIPSATMTQRLPVEFSPRKTRASRKRALEEIQSESHTHDDGKSNSDNLRASQRSADATRQTEKKPRHKLNACWRCKLLKKQVSTALSLHELC
jgi:hypothetical protein